MGYSAHDLLGDAVANFKFKDDVLDDFQIRKIQVQQRDKGDWVAAFWIHTGQEAIVTGETSLEAFQNAVEYLTNSFHLPPSLLQGSVQSEIPMTEYSIKRNRNRRILSPGEALMKKFQERLHQGEMEVLIPQNEIDETEKGEDALLPFGYPEIQGDFDKVQIPQEEMGRLKKHFDDLPTQSYPSEKKYLLWVKTLANKMKEACPFDLHRSAVVATGNAKEEATTFYYFKVDSIKRDLVVIDPEPVIVNFSHHENFQVQLYGMDESLILPEHVKESTAQWSRIDLDDE